MLGSKEFAQLPDFYLNWHTIVCSSCRQCIYLVSSLFLRILRFKLPLYPLRNLDPLGSDNQSRDPQGWVGTVMSVLLVAASNTYWGLVQDSYIRVH